MGVEPAPPSPPRRGCPGVPPAPGAGGGRRGPAGAEREEEEVPRPRGWRCGGGCGQQRAGPGSSEPVPAPPRSRGEEIPPLPAPHPRPPPSPRPRGGLGGRGEMWRGASLRAARSPPGLPTDLSPEPVFTAAHGSVPTLPGCGRACSSCSAPGETEARVGGDGGAPREGSAGGCLPPAQLS